MILKFFCFLIISIFYVKQSFSSSHLFSYSLKNTFQKRFFTSAISFDNTYFNPQKTIKLTDVTARDGLQSWPKEKFSINERVDIIQASQKTGFSRIEIGSFVKPDLLPSVSQPEQVIEKLFHHQEDQPQHHPIYSFLAPNIKGMESFLKCHEKYPSSWKDKFEASFFTSACPIFLNKNTGFNDVNYHLAQAHMIMNAATLQHVKFTRAYVSMVFGSPFGPTPSDKDILDICLKLYFMGYKEIVPSDTTGTATPKDINRIFTLLQKYGIPSSALAFHAHDLGLGISNIIEATRVGISMFDVSVCGIGGCPFSLKAPKNINARSLYKHLLHEEISTSLNSNKLEEAENIVNSILKLHQIQ